MLCGRTSKIRRCDEGIFRSGRNIRDLSFIRGGGGGGLVQIGGGSLHFMQPKRGGSPKI